MTQLLDETLVSPVKYRFRHWRIQRDPHRRDYFFLAGL